MCVHVRVAKEVKCQFQFRVDLCAENKNNSITCKFAYILDVFLVCCTRWKIKKYRQRQNTEEKSRKTESKRNRVALFDLTEVLW